MGKWFWAAWMGGCLGVWVVLVGSWLLVCIAWPACGWDRTCPVSTALFSQHLLFLVFPDFWIDYDINYVCFWPPTLFALFVREICASSGPVDQPNSAPPPPPASSLQLWFMFILIEWNQLSLRFLFGPGALRSEGRSILVSVRSSGYLRPKVCFVLCMYGCIALCPCLQHPLPHPLQLCVREWACGCCARNSVDLAATAAAVPRRIPLPYCFVKSSAQLAETHGLRSGAKRKGFRCCSRYADALGEIRGRISFA